VGRCVCISQFDDQYGCDRCTLRLKPTFSYSGEGMELTSIVKTRRGLVDFCDVPVGGAACKVGRCARDEDNRTIECPGDIDCDEAGSGGGICVGADDTVGRCVCGQGYFCRDCSLHRQDLERGIACGQYITGGALCQDDDDCGPAVAGYCATPKFQLADEEFDTVFDRAANMLDHVASQVRPFCKCSPGWTCRRCERRLRDLEHGSVSCGCDTPVLEPDGGESNNTEWEVDLLAKPWDSELECDVFYYVQRVRHFPAVPLWKNDAEALAGLRKDGRKLRFRDDGSERILVLKYDAADLDTLGSLGVGPGLEPLPMGPRNPERRVPQFYLVYAVTVPKENSTWDIATSSVARSKLFRLNRAARALGSPPPLALSLLALWSAAALALV